MTAPTRLAAYEAVSTSLALQDNGRLEDLWHQAAPHGHGIGGATRLLEVAGRPVFAKAVPLTDLERRPAHVMSTANLFDLPEFYQYGVGSTGFGAWRELATHIMTTNWALTRQCGSFPLMYHWRVLPGPVEPSADASELEETVAYWDGSPAVRRRLEEIASASARIILFLEYVPHNLRDWLTCRLGAGDEAVRTACDMVHRELEAGVAFMAERGLLHLDAHFGNVLTDGRRLYFADFGLATSSQFALSETEVKFFRRHLSHDRRHVLSQLVYWLVAGLSDTTDRFGLIRQCASGRYPSEMPEAAATLVARYAPMANVMNDFYQSLRWVSRRTVFPSFTGENTGTVPE